MTPDPGIYYDVSNEDYHSWDGVLSKSRLWNMVRSVDRYTHQLELSPGQFKYYMDNGKPKTKALRFGDAFDCLVLEPHDFEQRFVMTRPCTAIIASGKTKGKPCGSPGKSKIDGEWRCGKHGGSDEDTPPELDALSHIDMAKMRAMKKSLYAHPVASRLLQPPARAQVAIVGHLLGELTSGKLDLLNERDNHIIDLKTSENPYPWAFWRDVSKYGYDMQAFTYSALASGHKLIDAAKTTMTWIVVGKNAMYGCGSDAPHPVFVYSIRLAADGPIIKRGIRRYKELIAMYAQCKESGNWPDTLDETVIDLDTLNDGDTTDESF
jgi:hypothetical protein